MFISSRRFLHNHFSMGQLQMAQIKTFAFIDLETTGLPCFDNKTTKITELTVLTVQTKHLLLGVIPRVQNKLSLCFNPYKLISLDSERLTGLSNEALEHSAPFSASTVSLLVNFLEHSPKPLCLVAHNGNRFDYPILRTEIEKTGYQFPEDILCIDSLNAFRALHAHEEQVEEVVPESVPLEFQDGFDELLCTVLDEYESSGITSINVSGDQGVKRALEVQKINETTPKKASKNNSAVCKEIVKNETAPKAKKVKVPASKRQLNFGVSFKLVDVFERLTNQKAENAHQAENDVIMLAVCAATLGQKFIDWAEGNSKKFRDIPQMHPLKKIGT